MSENPYTPPETPSETLPRKRIRFGLGNVVFLGLGSALVMLPASAVMWAISDSRTIPTGVGIGVDVLVVLGLLLIAHGILRSKATIAIVSYALFAIVALVVMAAVAGILL